MPMGLTITEAGAGDVDELSALAVETYVAAFGADFDDPADLQAHLETALSVRAWRSYLATDRVFVARSAGRAVGYLQLGPAAPHSAVEIRRVYISHARQQQGLGSLLMRHALNLPEVRRAPLVRLDVWQDNLQAQRFYARFGFELTSERKPFVLGSGKIDGYDLMMIRRQDPAA